MSRKFNELRSNMSSGSTGANELEFRRLVMESMPLQKLRSTRKITQTSLAKVLKVSQSEVSKIENRADVYVSTLSNYVEAMGGQLEIRAVFPDIKVRINQFDFETPVMSPTVESRPAEDNDAA